MAVPACIHILTLKQGHVFSHRLLLSNLLLSVSCSIFLMARKVLGGQVKIGGWQKKCKSLPSAVNKLSSSDEVDVGTFFKLTDKCSQFSSEPWDMAVDNTVTSS